MEKVKIGFREKIMGVGEGLKLICWGKEMGNKEQVEEEVKKKKKK